VPVQGPVTENFQKRRQTKMRRLSLQCQVPLGGPNSPPSGNCFQGSPLPSAVFRYTVFPKSINQSYALVQVFTPPIRKHPPRIGDAKEDDNCRESESCIESRCKDIIVFGFSTVSFRSQMWPYKGTYTTKQTTSS
jgi:hypothetical protein